MAALVANAAFISVSASDLGVSPTLASEIAGQIQFSVNISHELHDVTTFIAATDRVRTAKLRDATFTLSGFYEAGGTPFDALMTAALAGGIIYVSVLYNGKTSASGHAFQLRVESTEISGSVDGMIEASFTMQLHDVAADGTSITVLTNVTPA